MLGNEHTAAQPATVIADWTEENQEGALCRLDKQAASLKKHRAYVDCSPLVLPFNRPHNTKALSQPSEICLRV